MPSSFLLVEDVIKKTLLQLIFTYEWNTQIHKSRTNCCYHHCLLELRALWGNEISVFQQFYFSFLLICCDHFSEHLIHCIQISSRKRFHHFSHICFHAIFFLLFSFGLYTWSFRRNANVLINFMITFPLRMCWTIVSPLRYNLFFVSSIHFVFHFLLIDLNGKTAP